MRYINLPFTAAYSIQPENDGVRGQRDKIAATNFTVAGLSAVNRAWPPLYSLHFIHPTSLMLSFDSPWCEWRPTHEIGYLALRSNARRACRLHPVDGWTIIGWAKRWQTSSIDTPGRRVTPTAESVSVPYSNPMFDVPAISRFYRCSISDVHIGRSLLKCHFKSTNAMQPWLRSS